MDIIKTETGELDYIKTVELAEKLCLQQEQVECPVIHRFGPGIYIREVHLPARTFVIGHHHNFEHVNIMLKGRLTILNENGTTSELTAPYFYIAKPGRKVAYIHEDVVWQNIFATNERDIEELESMFLTKSDYWIENKQLRDNITRLQHEGDREDYLKMLSDVSIPNEIARKITENESDQIYIPMDNYKVMLSDSMIEGKGLFATATIEANEIIAPARINKMRTFAGRYVNHALNPNSRMIMNSSGDFDLVAVRQIKGCHGGFNGEEITIDYRQSIALVYESEAIQCQQ